MTQVEQGVVLSVLERKLLEAERNINEFKAIFSHYMDGFREVGSLESIRPSRKLAEPVEESTSRSGWGTEATAEVEDCNS